MKRQLLCLLILLSASFVLRAQDVSQPSVQEILNPDGTLREGASGSFKAEGYQMRTGPNGQPIFTPITNNWSSLGTGVSFTPNPFATFVNAIAVAGNDVYVGGRFNVAGTVSANHVAKFNTATNTWSALGLGVSFASDPNQTSVNGAVVVGNDVYFVGNFTQAGGSGAVGIARFNTTTGTWSAVSGGVGAPVNPIVNTIIHSGNFLFVGGSFTQAGSIPVGNIARYDLNTGTWSSVGAGSPITVNAIGIVGNNVVAGGPQFLALYNSQTNTWSSLGQLGFSPVPAQMSVNTIAVSGNDVYIGGQFNLNGTSPSNRIIRWNAQTNTFSSLASLNGGEGVNSIVSKIIVSNNDIYVIGQFSNANVGTPIPVSRVAKFNTQLNQWFEVSGGINGPGTCAFLDGSRLYVGGQFSGAGTTTANRIAVFDILPTVNLFNARQNAQGAVVFGGNINPNELGLTQARFEISTDANFSSIIQSINTTPNAVGLGSGTLFVNVSATVSLPQGIYYYRLVASNANGSTTSRQLAINTNPNVLPSLPTNGLSLWLRADTLVTDSSGIVTQWGDISGNNRNAFSTLTQGPLNIRGDLGYNGRPRLVFDNAGNKHIGFGRMTSVRTAIVVAGSSQPTVTQFLFGDSTTIQFEPTATALVSNSASFNITNGFIYLNTVPRVPTSVNRPNVPSIVHFQTDGAVNVSTLGLDRNNTTVGWRGGVSEVIIYDRVLTLSERLTIENYIAQRYAIGDTSTTAAVPANQSGLLYVPGNTGASILITTPSIQTGTISTSMSNQLPQTFGSLPTGVVSVAERFWNISQTNLLAYAYALTLDLTGINGIQNFNTLKVLRRNNSASPWVDVETISGVTVTRMNPFINIRGLSQVGEFAIGGGTDNIFPLSPSVSAIGASNITSTSATLNGAINPNGFPLSLSRFEYSLDSTFTSGVTNVNTTPNTAGIGSGLSTVSVSATISIQANSTYYFRLRATNTNGTSISQIVSFNNIPPPPSALPNSGLQLWLRADSIVTQTSGLISQWNDLSGNNRHAFSTGSARPTLASSAAFNNRAVIDFGTVGDKQLGFRRMTNVRTAFIVGRSTAATTFQFLLGDSTTFQFHPSNTGLVDAGFAAAAVRNGLVFLNGRPFLATAANRPSTPTIMMFQTTGNAEASLIAGDRNLPGARGWRGEIAEVIIYNRVLSEAERAQIQSYLAQRYAIDVQTSATPSVPANNFGSFVLGNTGVTVTFTTASTTAGSLSGSVTNSRPTVVGSLPTGIVNLAERFWTINQTNLTGFTCALTFDLSTLGGVQNFANLKVLRRANASSPWVNVETLPGVTITRNAPFITVAGLTSFSDFAIGSDASNQLPVELTEFGFRKADSGIELHWRTATELNNSGFEVERKSHGTDWNTLGFVRGNGTTTEAQSYSFLDRTASGKVQYRLKQIDFDGQFEYSNVIEVDAGLPKQFALEQNYPNPFNPTTTIGYQLPVASEVSLKVYDVLGREVMTLVNGRQDAGAYNITLNAATLSSGIYFYRLQSSATNGASSSNFVQTKKMMLVK